MRDIVLYLYTICLDNGRYIPELLGKLYLYFPPIREKRLDLCRNLYMYFLRVSSIRAFGTAPTIWSTRLPFLKINKVGIAIRSNLPEVAWFSSVFNFPKAPLPLTSLAIRSL